MIRRSNPPAQKTASPARPRWALEGLDRRHLAALEDLCPGLLIWVGQGWRRNGLLDHTAHDSLVINQLLHRGLIATTHDNLTITPLGIKARHHLDMCIKNTARLRQILA
jgi:hypothetical protein